MELGRNSVRKFRFSDLNVVITEFQQSINFSSQYDCDFLCNQFIYCSYFAAVCEQLWCHVTSAAVPSESWLSAGGLEVSAVDGDSLLS